MKTVLVPCERDGANVVVVDSRRTRHPIPRKVDPEIRQTGPHTWGVEAELLDRDGNLAYVRLPGGDRCWTRTVQEAAV